jgi:hypothetical protein
VKPSRHRSRRRTGKEFANRRLQPVKAYYFIKTLASDHGIIAPPVRHPKPTGRRASSPRRVDERG